MFSKIQHTLSKHIQNNRKIYFWLVITFTIGICAGAFTVNGLSAAQNEELTNYFKGFLQLFGSQSVDSSELFILTLMQNLKIVFLLWILGVCIVGIPFIFVVLSVRGFITGFTAGFVLKVMGAKGILFTLLTILPKEIIMIPCFLMLGVSGINFSINIIRKKSIKQISKDRENLKSSFAAYSIMTLIVTLILIAGVAVDVYITPVFIRLLAS